MFKDVEASPARPPEVSISVPTSGKYLLRGVAWDKKEICAIVLIAEEEELSKSKKKADNEENPRIKE